VEERTKKNEEIGRLPQASRCEVCGYEAWCIHAIEKIMKGGHSEEKSFSVKGRGQ